jgi:hypothetical protein
MKQPVVLRIGGVDFNASFDPEVTTPTVEDQMELLKKFADACEGYDLRLINGLLSELADMITTITPAALMFIAEVDEQEQPEKTAQTMLNELGIDTNLSGLKPKGNA